MFKAASVPVDVHFARNSPFGVGTQTDYFSFFIFLLVGLVYFFYETLSKKVDPIFADRFTQCGRPRATRLLAQKEGIILSPHEILSLTTILTMWHAHAERSAVYTFFLVTSGFRSADAEEKSLGETPAARELESEDTG